jgi:hypothetical protein
MVCGRRPNVFSLPVLVSPANSNNMLEPDPTLNSSTFPVSTEVAKFGADMADDLRTVFAANKRHKRVALTERIAHSNVRRNTQITRQRRSRSEAELPKYS